MLGAALAGCFGSGKPEEASSSPTPEPLPAESPPPAPPPPSLWTNTSVFPGTYRYEYEVYQGRHHFNYSRVAVDGTLAVLPLEIQEIPSPADGEPIQIGVVRPDVPEGMPVPVIAVASPYFRDLARGDLIVAHSSNPTQIVRYILLNFVPHGYAAAFIPLRGTGGSGGCYEWWSAAETLDARAAIDWLGAQPWSNGRVGMIGLSLSGAAAWAAAGGGSPYLRTIVPVASETDFADWFLRNGTSAVVAGPFGTTAFFGFYSLSPFDGGPFVARDPESIQGALLCPGAAEGLAASLALGVAGIEDPLGYVASRDLRPDVDENYNGTILLVHGLNDWLAYPHLVFPWVQSLEDRGLAVKQIIGQWRHRMPDDQSRGPFYNPNLRVDFAEILLHWFDRWLKGNETVDIGPKVQVADNHGAWRNEADWPPPDANATAFFLHGGGGLRHAPGTTAATALLVPDPLRSVTHFEHTGGPEPPACSYCPKFATDPLDAELRVAGLPHLNLTATPSGPGGVITAYLYERADGRDTRVGWATMDLRYRSGGTTPQTVVPGQAVSVRLEFEPLDVVLPAGSQLVLELFEGGYGEGVGEYLSTQALAPAAFYRTNPPPGPIQIQVGTETSVLTVPQIHRAQESFFQPPALPS